MGVGSRHPEAEPAGPREASRPAVRVARCPVADAISERDRSRGIDQDRSVARDRSRIAEFTPPRRGDMLRPSTRVAYAAMLAVALVAGGALGVAVGAVTKSNSHSSPLTHTVAVPSAGAAAVTAPHGAVALPTLSTKTQSVQTQRTGSLETTTTRPSSPETTPQHTEEGTRSVPTSSGGGGSSSGGGGSSSGGGGSSSGGGGTTTGTRTTGSGGGA
jgi:uncharacterized membrane protein YgcG